MFQGTFALFNRTLSVDFRQTRAHLFRFLFTVMILFCLMSAHMASRMVGAAGLILFTQIIYLNFVFILMAGVSFFATAITEEKEEQTIGLLLMAGVNPISLLLGKSLPRLVSALLLLSVQFPFTLLAITLGGVTFSQVIAVYSSLAVFLFCLSNLGLLCSVICDRSRSASTLVVIALAAFFWGVPLFDWALNVMIQEKWIAATTLPVTYANLTLEWLSQSSVLRQINIILTSGFSESPWGIQFWSNLISGMVLFLLSCLLFSRFALTEVSTSPGRGIVSKKKSLLFSPGRSWANALMWKDFFFVNGGYGMAMIKFICFGIALFALCSFIGYTSRSYSREEIGLTVFWTMVIVLLIEISLISARVFHVEVQWKTLVSTSMLPQSMAKTAYSKVAGCLIGIIPACIYLFLGAVLSIYEMIDDVGMILSEPTFWMLCIEVLFFWHLTALLSTYIKWGALPLAFILMWVGNMFFFFAMSLLSVVGGAKIAEPLSIVFTLAMFVCIVISHFLIKERLIQLASL